ncbi:hypothetical protein TNCV_65571 [Trichonephila clavipes]|nr:hypothetical protein TNCV_65571 [Trichonephila clavipes]
MPPSVFCIGLSKAVDYIIRTAASDNSNRSYTHKNVVFSENLGGRTEKILRPSSVTFEKRLSRTVPPAGAQIKFICLIADNAEVDSNPNRLSRCHKGPLYGLMDVSGKIDPIDFQRVP